MRTNDKLGPGVVLGRYELLVPIASGGMATVWAARQRGTRGFNKTVAIKTMLPTLSDDAQFEQMFLDEAALAARIHHPNVAEILDLGEQDETLYIVMEWVDGEALSVLHKAARKNDSHIPLRLALRVAIQACAALHAAHELRDENDQPLRLVHRDVSPQNILCTYDGIVKLVDFGVAKAIGRAGGETTAGQLKGKVPYMSPEQARGGVIDRRTDIFALGIVLYKLTTSLHPFLGETDIITMRNIISRPLIPPRIKNPAFPVEVEQVLTKCLHKEADRRYQTMTELAGALERVLAGMGPSDDDLGAFVRGTMGEIGAKRRAAVRDAVRAADERFATGTHLMVSIPLPPVSRADGSSDANGPASEHTSDALLTKMATGVKEAMLTDGRIGSVTSVPSSPSVTTGAPGASRTSSPGPASQPSVESHSLTQQGVSVVPYGQRSKRAAPLAIALAIATVILGFAGFRAMRLRAANAARPVPTAATVAPAPTAPVPSALASSALAPSAPAPPPSAAPEVSASAATSAAAPAPGSVDAGLASATPVASATPPRSGHAWGGPPPDAPVKPGPGKRAEETMNAKGGGVPIYTNPGF
jgi:serine/threonine-protein kinase